MANEQNPFTTFNFSVQLTIPNGQSLGLSSPLCSSEFSEVDGLEMTMEAKTFHQGGDNTRQVHLVGPVSYANLTLKRGMTANQDLWKWFIACSSGTRRGVKASGVILMYDEAGTVGGQARVRYRLTDCLPTKIKAPSLNAKDGILAIEELQIAYGSLAIELA